MNKKYVNTIIIRTILIYLIVFHHISEEFLIKKNYKNRDISNCEKIRNIYQKHFFDLTRTVKNYTPSVLHINKLCYNLANIYEKTKEEDVSSPTSIKPKLKKKEKKILKKYKDFLDLIPNKKNEYEIVDALEKIKTLAIHKFTESIDVYLSFSSKRSKMTKNDNIKTYITFPHNLKKKKEKTLYVITNREMRQAALDAGGDVAGEDDVINKIKEKEIKLQKKNTNFLICTNDVIHKVTKIGKEVGRKGLMPNEKCGTLVSPVLLTKHINMFKFQNTHIFKLNKLNTLNMNIGDVHMTNDAIRENVCHLFEYLENLEFFHFNFKNLKTIYLSSTMGFPFKIKKNFL